MQETNEALAQYPHMHMGCFSARSPVFNYQSDKKGPDELSWSSYFIRHSSE